MDRIHRHRPTAWRKAAAWVAVGFSLFFSVIPVSEPDQRLWDAMTSLFTGAMPVVPGSYWRR